MDELLLAATAETCRPYPRRVLEPEAWSHLLTLEPATELLAMWADTIAVHALLRSGTQIRPVSVLTRAGRYPALSPHRPAAAWFERAIADLWGHRADGASDERPWLDHGRWTHAAPLSPKPVPRAGMAEPPHFLAVGSDDLHQHPLGPIHGTFAEPAHYRVHACGEHVVSLELRLGYAHKGTLGLMRGKSPRAAARFACRLSGDSAVAHAIAFARAAEAATGTDAPPRAHALRGVMAEIERIANHLGDIGAIAGAAAFPLITSRTAVHRETLLRAAEVAFGHRLMMDAVIPGGVAADIAAEGAQTIRVAIEAVAEASAPLARLYDESGSLAERTVGTGRTPPELVARFAAGGIVGRAAGRALDVRTLLGSPPYDGLAFKIPVLTAGDVDARVQLRFAEIGSSIEVLRRWLGALPDGAVSVPLPMASGEGIGWAEGFRGDIWHWLRLDGGQIGSVFPRDPSWLQWPLLEAAMRDAEVTDLPLIAASFNASVSGVDL